MERLTFAAIGKVQDGIFTGTAHVYGQVTVDGRKHSFAPGAFAKSIAAGEVLAYWEHGTPFRLGSQKAGTLQLTDGPTELDITLKLPNTSYADDLKALTDAGEELGVSFEFYPSKPARKANGITTWTEGRLSKINLVDAPAFEGTNVILSSEQEGETATSTTIKIRARTLSGLC
jgi:HK97 family phage prohead protease